MKYIIYFLIFGFIFSCAKHTTPKKVERILTKGSWQLVTFVDNGVNLMDSYKDVTFSFGKNGEVLTTSENGVSGDWYVGSDRKPAVIYISFPDLDSMNVISDDWAVVSLTKKECTLKRNLGKTDGEEKIDYDQITDNISLVKN